MSFRATKRRTCFSALQRAEIAEIVAQHLAALRAERVSVLFNEPKLLKSLRTIISRARNTGFSALQRAEIAEIRAALMSRSGVRRTGFSALQRAEIAEIYSPFWASMERLSFSALQRAEIAEIRPQRATIIPCTCFSALQRAEIAEIPIVLASAFCVQLFQCSSTSRNC